MRIHGKPVKTLEKMFCAPLSFSDNNEVLTHWSFAYVAMAWERAAIHGI